MDYPGILLRPIALLRKEQVWMAEGDDITLYNANKSIIKSLLEHSGIPESDHKLWIGIYRIGTSQEQARPAIVVSCLDPKVRKQAKGSIKSCSLFRQGGAFAHFAVLGKATPPELPCEPQLTMESYTQEQGLGLTTSSLPYQPKERTSQGPEGDVQENTEGQIVLQVFGSHTEDNYLCRPIQARRGLQRQSATAGPLLLLDGTTYQLTVEHVVNFDRPKSEPTWEHTNDDWDDDEDDDDAGSYRHAEGLASSGFDTLGMMSEGSRSSEDAEIDFSGSSSSSSAQKLEVDTSWSSVGPASTSRPQSFSEPRTVSYIAVKDYSSSPEIELISSPTLCHISEKLDYVLFPLHVNPDPELCITGGAEMVGVSDVFDVHGQTTSRSVIITTAPLGYVRGIIFPAPTLLQKPGSRSFQTLFCIESASPMPKGTSGSAVFDAQTGLLAGYLVLGCLGKCTCYMVPMCDVLAELNTLSSSTFQCQVRLDVSAIVEVYPERSAIARFSFHGGGHSRSVPLPSIALREEAIKHINQPVLDDPPAYLPGVFPHPTDHDEKKVKRKKSPRNPPKFSLLGGYVARMMKATREWVSEPADEWKERFGQTITLSGSLDSQPYLDFLRDDMFDIDEVQGFCHPNILTARSERATLHVEQFCAGAEFVLHRFSPGDTTLGDFEEPRAWVSDRNRAPEGPSSPQRAYGKVLGSQELYHVLQKKRFGDGPCDDTAVYCRRIYIDKPNGASVLALIRTTPHSQVEGFRQLFADYITPTPEPKIILRESDRLQRCFIFSFSLPFFGIQHQVHHDCRTISNGGRQLRYRYDLSFLDSGGWSSEDDEPTSSHPALLHEAVWSFTLTGMSDRYWTAVFFDENLFDEEPRLHTDEEVFEIGGETDPILQVEASVTPTSPRSYALAALATALRRIVDHHADILDWLKTSFDLHMSAIRPAIRQDPPAKTSLLSAMMSKVISSNSKNTAAKTSHEEWMDKFSDVLERVTDKNSSLLLKLDQFLSEDVMLDTDALPRGLLWRSLQSDANSLRTLRRIKQCRRDFRDIEVQLGLFLKKVEKKGFPTR